MGVAATLAWLPSPKQAALGGLAWALGTAAVALLGAAVGLRRAAPLPWALALLLGAYLLSRVDAPRLDAWTPAYAAGLVALTEIAHAALAPEGTSRALTRRQVVRVVALVTAAGLVSAAVLAAVALPLPHGLLVQTAGVGAAAASIGILAALARRHLKSR